MPPEIFFALFAESGTSYFEYFTPFISWPTLSPLNTYRAIINLKTLFKNHFDTKEISDDNTKKFAEDHLARLVANDPGTFGPITAQVGGAYTAYFGAIANEDTDRAVQQALTVQVDNATETFKGFVSSREGAVRDAFGEDGPEYQEFFPQGKSEYARADRASIEQLMNRFATAATKYAPSLPVGYAAQVAGLRTSYQSVRTVQLGKKGEVGDSIDTSIATCDTPEKALTASFHYIAFTYPGDVKQCIAYFDQRFLRDANSPNGGTPPTE